MRGEQIAAQRQEWTAENNPNRDQIENSDVVVIVKRASAELVNLLRRCDKPVIWDALDFWSQPYEALEVDSIVAARAIAQGRVDRLKPVAIITPNRIMESDLRGMADIVSCVYHHYDPALTISKGGEAVVYEGDPRFPQEWLQIASRILSGIGWKLLCSRPPENTGALFAVRAGEHGSWLARRWKSNVKAANAIALGVPLLAWPEDSYTETLPAEIGYWFSGSEQLKKQIARLSIKENLIAASKAAEKIRPLYSVAHCAAEYEKLFEKVLGNR